MRSTKKILFGAIFVALGFSFLPISAPIAHAAVTQAQIDAALNEYSTKFTAQAQAQYLNTLKATNLELAQAVASQINATVQEYNNLETPTLKDNYLKGLENTKNPDGSPNIGALALRVITGNVAMHDNAQLRELRSSVGSTALNQAQTQLNAIQPNLGNTTIQNIQQSTSLTSQVNQIQQSKFAEVDDFGCSFTNATGINGGKAFATCIASIVYYIGPGLASKVAYVGAYFFSIVIQLSLNSTAYALGFLSDGWTTVRDLANMSFIFILVYIAMTVMLQAETSGTIKTLAIVIVIALLVNFSFFFTRAVIDAGNILALQFYNAIPMQKNADGTPATLNGVKDLSASIMNGVKLQQLFSTTAFDQAQNAAGGSITGGLITLSFIYLSVAAMFWMLFFAFLQVGIKFMLRIVGLWFLLIASPLAFVAKTMKKTQGYFDQWLKKLVEFSLYPAIFLFMFLILVKFVTTMLVEEGSGGSLINVIFNSTSTSDPSNLNTSIAGAVAAVAIRMGFIIALMYVALKVSDWVVKDVSGIASSVTNRVAGMTAGMAKGVGRFGGGLPIRGLAAGGGALGRGTVGWAGNALSRSTWARGLESRGGVAGIFGRGMREVGKAAGNKTYDARNIPGAGTILGAGGILNVGTGQKDGYIKRTAATAAAKEKRAKDLEPTAGEKQKAMETNQKYRLTKSNNERTLNEAKADIQKADVEIKQLTALGYGADEAKKQKAEAEETAKSAQVLLDENEKYLKKVTGEGLKKTYAETLTVPFNLAAGNPGFVTRSSREAAAKILKGKTAEQEFTEAAEKLAKEKAAEEGGHDDDGGGSSGGGGGSKKGGGGSSSPSAGGSHSTPSASGGGAHASLDSNVENAIDKQTEVVKRIERLMKYAANNAPHSESISAPEINVSELGKAAGKSIAKNLENSETTNVIPLRTNNTPVRSPQNQPPRANNDTKEPPEAKAA